MILNETTITVVEDNDALLTIQVNVVDRSTDPPTVGAYDFTGATDITFLIKSGVSTPDNDPSVVSYTLGNEVSIVGAATAGRITVQTARADNVAGSLRYRIDAIKNGKKESVMAGPYIVKNL